MTWSDSGFRTPDGPGEVASTKIEKSRPKLRAELIDEETSRLSDWDETVYADTKLTIPGFGESGPGCGEYRPTGVCESCGEVEYGPHVCGKRTCSDCWGSWAKETAMKATIRVQAFRETQPANHKRQTGHFVYSPSEPPTTLRGVKELRKEAYEVGKEKGVRGGSAVVHPWRIEESVLEQYRATEREMGAWVWVRETFGEEWTEQVEWSPHVHVIGLMSPDMDEGRGDDVWRLIRTLDRYHGANDRNSHDEVYGVFRYLMSHAAVPQNSESLRSRTWFGELHGSVFSPESDCEEWKHERLKRVVEEVAEGVLTEAEAEQYQEEQEALDVGECPCAECEGVLIDVMRANEYLKRTEPPPEVANRLTTAYEWRMGVLMPPPGMKHPASQEEASEVLDHLL